MLEVHVKNLIILCMLMLDSVKFIAGNIKLGREKYKEKGKDDEEEEKDKEKNDGNLGK